MIIETKLFDKVEIKDTDIVEFIQPILGFEEYKQFILIDIEDNKAFKCLQSINNKNLCFILSDPWAYVKDYEFNLSQEVKESLNINSHDNVTVLNILKLSSDISNVSINLLAPIIINTENKTAAQYVIDNNKYSTRHFVKI